MKFLVTWCNDMIMWFHIMVTREKTQFFITCTLEAAAAATAHVSEDRGG